MIWSAKPGNQAGEWHFSVLAGNSTDARRIELSCGSEDGYEHVDLWYDCFWELEKVSDSSVHSGKHFCLCHTEAYLVQYCSNALCNCNSHTVQLCCCSSMYTAQCELAC